MAKSAMDLRTLASDHATWTRPQSTGPLHLHMADTMTAEGEQHLRDACRGVITNAPADPQGLSARFSLVKGSGRPLGQHQSSCGPSGNNFLAVSLDDACALGGHHRGMKVGADLPPSRPTPNTRQTNT